MYHFDGANERMELVKEAGNPHDVHAGSRKHDTKLGKTEEND